MTHSSEGRTLGTSAGYDLQIDTKAMADIPALPDEPYMSSFIDNVQAIRYQLVSVKPIGGFSHSFNDTWAKVGGTLADDEDFGEQLNRSLKDEDAIINKAKALKTDEEKIAYLFNEVKNTLKWDGVDRWYTIDGTHKAWATKTGNSAEINLILYHLLKKSNVEAYPMVVSTRAHGKVSRWYTSLSQFNRAVVYIPVDSTKNYILDATSKYNMYNEIPDELLNSLSLWIDKKHKKYDLVYLYNDAPVRQTVLINGEIKAGGKLEGTVEISSNSYNKINAVERYKTDGEKKYIEYLQNGDNNLKISSIAMENMDVDTLPLTQKVKFNLELAGSDENYIYLNPNLFTSLKTNIFLSEKRMTDIEFGYRKNYSISSVYKLPAGYKIDAMPKNITLVMPDKSISLRRIVAEQDGNIVLRYSINYNKIGYEKEAYPEFYEFFKKMHEMLNEQIILKKS